MLCSGTLGALALGSPDASQSTLKVTYGPSGVEKLSYDGVVLEDIAQYPADAFHIWHMKVTDLHGNVLSGGQYGWGEVNNGRSWDPLTSTWKYNFVWGVVTVNFVQNGDKLDINVNEENYATSGVVLDGVTVYPFALHLPRLPTAFVDVGYPQLAFNTTGPSVTVADYSSGLVAAVDPDARKPLYSGFWPTGNGISYTPIISSTTPDGIATFQPHNERPVQPGETDSFTVSLRFAATETSSSSLGADANASWAKIWPPQLKWKDRRPIGTVYLATSPSGNAMQPGGYANNPRRYFNNSSVDEFDVTNTTGLAKFQARVLRQARSNVVNMQRLGAQGAITWDVEGEQYPQSTSYVCQPDAIATIAPEMETRVVESRSPYAGMKLDDAYFRIMKDAGFRIGVCVRPQHFTLHKDGSAQQEYLANSAVGDEMIRKMKFAHDRWGATLFYVDSSVEKDGAVLDASIFQRLAQTFPDCLIMPEESTPKYYAYTAPFQTFIFHGDLGTDPSIRAYYPDAFSVNLVNDVNARTLAAKVPQLTRSVKNGDILMGHVGYWQANNPTIGSIYHAGKGRR